MAKLLNATPHNLTIIPAEGQKVEIPASGLTIRLSTTQEQIGVVDCDGVEIPVVRNQFGGLQFFYNNQEITPEQARQMVEDYDGIVVPILLEQAVPQLKEVLGDIKVYAPNTSRAIRDEAGRIIGVPSLILLG